MANNLSISLESGGACNVFLVNVEGVRRDATGKTEVLLEYSNANNPKEPVPDELAKFIGVPASPKWVRTRQEHDGLVVSLFTAKTPILAHIIDSHPVPTLDMIITLREASIKV